MSYHDHRYQGTKKMAADSKENPQDMHGNGKRNIFLPV